MLEHINKMLISYTKETTTVIIRESIGVLKAMPKTVL